MGAKCFVLQMREATPHCVQQPALTHHHKQHLLYSFSFLADLFLLPTV